MATKQSWTPSHSKKCIKRPRIRENLVKIKCEFSAYCGCIFVSPLFSLWLHSKSRSRTQINRGFLLSILIKIAYRGLNFELRSPFLLQDIWGEFSLNSNYVSRRTNGSGTCWPTLYESGKKNWFFHDFFFLQMPLYTAYLFKERRFQLTYNLLN